MKRNRMILWAVVVLAVAALVWCLWPKSGGKPEYDEAELRALRESLKPRVNMAEARVPADAPEPEPEPAEAVEGPESPAPAPEPEPEPPGPAVAPGKIALPNGRQIRLKLPPEGEVRTLHSGGKLYEIDSEGNVVDISPVPLFKEPIENHLLNVVEGKTVFPFVLENLKEEDIIHVCSAPTYQEEGDDEETVARRESVAGAKQYILEQIAAGKTAKEAIREITEFDAERRKLVGECRADLFTLIRNGDIEGARQYRAEVEAWMREKGYGELEIPARYRKSLEGGE